VIMGRISGPHGVDGSIKVWPFTEQVGALARFQDWWLLLGGEWKEVSVARAEARGRYLIARIAGWVSREEAAHWRGAEVAVPRESMQDPAPGEYYWADLEGVSVRNGRDEQLGNIVGVFSNGAHEILRVQGSRESGGRLERLIPYVPEIVREVSIEEGWIRVDWERDW